MNVPKSISVFCLWSLIVFDFVTVAEAQVTVSVTPTNVSLSLS